MEIYLVADIGGTNARFALVGADGILKSITTLACAAYPNVDDAINEYLEQVSPGQVSGVCLAIASPIAGDDIDLVNNHWHFRQSKLRERLGVPLRVINDFTAQALCLDYLPDDAIRWVGDPRPSGQKTRVVMGPGTGLGVAALLPDGQVIPSEGGHAGFSPTSDHQVALLQFLWERFGRVSIERLVSGQGLENLFWANAKLSGREKRLNARDIAALAQANDELARQAIDDFFDIFASAAADFVLTFWAADGMYLTGRVTEKLAAFFDRDRFRDHFTAKGRFQDFCAATPLGILQADYPGLLGCYGALRTHPAQ